MIAGLLVGNVVFHFFDNGLADVLDVETLRHGTNGINYMGIRAVGGDPNRGGKKDGSTEGWMEDDTKNYFFMFKDTELDSLLRSAPEFSSFSTITKFFLSFFLKHGLPRAHAFLSGYNFAARIIPENEHHSNVVKRTRVVFCQMMGTITVLFVPILRFRFSKIDPERLDNDPAYGKIAYRTRQKVEVWRIGILGTLVTGVNRDWFARVRANPIKFATGLVELTCAVGLVTLSGFAIMTAPYLAIPLIAGALLA